MSKSLGEALGTHNPVLLEGKADINHIIMQMSM